MRIDFENSIKCSASYEKLVYQHGERLFIFDDGKYKIAAVQLAWEIFKEQQSKVDELKCELKRINLWYSNVKLQLENKEIDSAIDAKKIDELQKRVDAVKQLIQEYRDPPTEDKTFCHALSIVAYELEQALKGW